MHPLTRESLNAGETLPAFYGEDTLVLMARDPYWLFSYWELTHETIDRQKATAGNLDQGKKILRVKKFDHQGKEMSTFDVSLAEDDHSWHIYAGEPDRTYQVELGCSLPDGYFVRLLTSNECHTPRDGISSVIDPLWGYLSFWQQRLFQRTLKYHLNSSELIRREKKLVGKKEEVAHE